MQMQIAETELLNVHEAVEGPLEPSTQPHHCPDRHALAAGRPSGPAAGEAPTRQTCELPVTMSIPLTSV